MGIDSLSKFILFLVGIKFLLFIFGCIIIALFITIFLKALKGED